MGEIKINIPKDMETAFEAAFPGEDKAGAILRLIQTEIAKPDRAPATIALLTHARFVTIASRAVYRRAADLSIALNHHLFDTLYHAVALEEGATLVTADASYFNKAKGLGGIVQLADFSI
jgi:predicted nucleic acid-binding protein